MACQLTRALRKGKLFRIDFLSLTTDVFVCDPLATGGKRFHIWSSENTAQ